MKRLKMSWLSALRVGAISLLLGSCTGGENALPNRAGGIRIAPGERVHVDLQDIVALNPRRYNVVLKTVGPDYLPKGDILDLTAAAKAALASGSTRFTFTLPKNTTTPKPFLLAVDIPDLNINDSLVDVVFSGNSFVRPGIASRLAFDLLDSYNTTQNPKPIQAYSEAEFTAIRGIIQSRIDALMSQSEKLSFSVLPYLKLMTFFRNGLAYNPWVLSAVRDFGVNFTFTESTYPGIVAEDTIENSLNTCTREICFKLARDFKINSENAPVAPFKARANVATEVPVGQAIPMPGKNIAVSEGMCGISGCSPRLSVVVKPFDPEGDHIEKLLWVKYRPRQLPPSMRNRPTFDPLKEPIEKSTALKSDSFGKYLPVTDISLDEPDRYELYEISHDEALLKRNYPDSVCAESGAPVFNDQCHTAYRDVFAMYTDGMVWVPYRWNFVYNDTNRKPEFIRNAQNEINSTLYDEAIQSGFPNPESDVPGVPGWKLHNSHCENNPNATPTPAAPPSAQPSGTPIINYYTRIQDKKDGPWSCAFLAFDPDIDQDPNGAPDQFYFKVTGRTMQTKIRLGGQITASSPGVPSTFTQMPMPFWPPPPPPATPRPPQQAPMELLSCPAGHTRCGAAIAQVTVDNAVKEQTPEVSFDIEVFDRAENGMFSMATAQRGVMFSPKPPLLINFSDPPTTRESFNTITNYFPEPNGQAEPMRLRFDAYLDEILAQALPVNNSYEAIGFDTSMLGNTNRANFRIQSLEPGLIDFNMSPYLTQPRSLCSSASPTDNGTQCRGTFNVGTATINGELRVTQGSPGTSVRMGNSLRFADSGTYSFPREYDFSCFTNSGPGWNQTPVSAATGRNTSGGWAFEINFIDFDNVNLNPDEPPEVMYLSPQNNVRHSDSLFYCNAPAPNMDSPILGHVYTATNAAGTNAKDPDQCLSLAPFQGKITLQPVPVLYEGTETLGAAPSIRKLVYHRIRGIWRPKDQGLEGKTDNQDPRGLIQNALTRFKVFGRLHDLGLENKDFDRSEPIVFQYGRNIPRPLQFLAQKREMAPCLAGNAISNSTQQLSSSNPNGTEIRFAIQDENKTNSTVQTFAGSVRGYDEAQLEVLGSRTLGDSELLKFIPYLSNCTVSEPAPPSMTVNVTHRWTAVPGANGYIVDVVYPGGSQMGNIVASTSHTATNLPAFRDVDFIVHPTFPNPTPPLPSQTPTPNPIQTTYQTYALAPATSTTTPTLPRPAVWSVSNPDLVSSPFIRLRAAYDAPISANPFCLKANTLPLTGAGGAAFDGVWRVARTDTTTTDRLKLASIIFSNCTDQPNVLLHADAKALYFAVKRSANSACNVPVGQQVLDQNLDWRNPDNSPATPGRLMVHSVWALDPTSAEFGSLSLPVALTSANYFFDLFPSLFGRTTGLPNFVTAAHYNEQNRLLFFVRPLNQFIYNNVFQSISGYGRNTYAGAWNPTEIGATAISSQLLAGPPDLENRLPLTNNTEYSAFSRIPHLPINAGGTYDVSISYGDVDAQINKLVTPGTLNSGSLVSGDPDTYFRMESSNQVLAIYAKPLPSSTSSPRTISIPVQALDQYDEANPKVEDDPYDVITYGISTIGPSSSPVPQEIPSLSGFGTRGANCNSGPSTYPTTISTRNLVSLQDFKRCILQWRIFPQDAGKEFSFNLVAQDNLGATPSVPGVGGSGNQNGPSRNFTVRIFSLEQNQKPFFTSTPGSTTALSSASYNGGTSVSSWNQVFTTAGGASQAGVQPTCIPGSTSLPYSCVLSPPASATLAVGTGDVLINSTPIEFDESALVGQVSPEYEIQVHAKDTASLDPLKNIIVDSSRPTRGVLIAGGANKGATYLMPSWTSLSVTESGASDYDVNSDGTNDTRGKTFTIRWRPRDEEARFLSNSEGFLIPFNLTDSPYVPGGSGAPAGFQISAERVTAWVWVRLKVRNHPPLVSYFVNPGANPNASDWKSLNSGETIEVVAGKSSTVRVRVVDADHARVWAPNGGVNSTELASSYLRPADTYPHPYFQPIDQIAGFSTAATPSAPSSVTADTFMGLNDSNGRRVIQQTFDFTVSPPAGESAVKKHEIKIHVRDPGDPTLDLALNGSTVDSSGSPKRVVSPLIELKLNVNVTGKAGFLAPKTQSPPILITSPRSTITRMNFRLALKVTNASDLAPTNATKNFFMGILVRGATSTSPNTVPTATPSSGQIPNNSGFYVDQNYSLFLTQGSFASSSNEGQIRRFELGAVNNSHCPSSLMSTAPTATNPSPVTYPIVLARINTSGTPAIQYCYLTPTAIADGLAQTAVDHQVTAELQYPAVPSSLFRAEIERLSRPLVTSSQPQLNAEFQDFFNRCRSFTGGAGYCSSYDGGTLSLSGGNLTTGGATGDQVVYNSSNNQQAVFSVSSTDRVTKIVRDLAPSNSRSLEAYALKGEALKFTAEIDPAFGLDPARPIFARWYVNGCLNQVDTITSASLPPFEIKASDRGAGPQNDCSGKFERTNEPLAGDLGLYLVRLVLVNGGEATNTSNASLDHPASSTSATYLYRVRVVNTRPEVMTNSSGRGAVSVALSQATVPLAIPFKEYSRNLIAFVAKDTTSQTANFIRIRELTSTGDLLTSSATVNCAVSETPRWLGVHPVGSNLNVALLGNSSRWSPGLDLASAYPSSDSLYGSNSFGCYRSFASSAISGVVQPGAAGSSMVASTAALSKYTASSRVTANWGGSYLFDSELPSDTNASRTVSSREFWSSTTLLQSNPACPNGSGSFLPNLFGCNPNPYTAFPKNRVYKMFTSGNTLFQLMGPGPGIGDQSQGQILVHSLSASASWSGNTAISSNLRTLTFGPSTGGGTTCVIPNTVLPFPVDATYHSQSDTLYVITTDTGSSALGDFMIIRGATTSSPSCSSVGKVAKPSTDPLVNNTNLTKMVVDANRGLVYALITLDSSGELIVYDTITGLPPERQTLGFSPLTLLLYDTGQGETHNNLALIMSRQYVTSSNAPALYRLY